MSEIDPRTFYAVERTILAWIRTGLALMGFGFVLARFSLLLKQLSQKESYGHFETPGVSLWIGISLVALGALVNITAGLRYAQDLKKLRTGMPITTSTYKMGKLVSIILALIGLVMVIYLIKLS